jgi:hypothetical protein
VRLDGDQLLWAAGAGHVWLEYVEYHVSSEEVQSERSEGLGHGEASAARGIGLTEETRTSTSCILVHIHN